MGIQSPIIGLVFNWSSEGAIWRLMISAIPFAVMPMAAAVLWLLSAHQTTTYLDVVIVAAGFAVGTSFSPIMSFIIVGLPKEMWPFFIVNLTLPGLHFFSGTLTGLVILSILKARRKNENTGDIVV